MNVRTSKEAEVAGRMQHLLVQSGFTRTEEGESQDVFEETGGKRRVVLTRLDNSIHDPVEAEVFDPSRTRDIAFAYNSAGLANLLGRSS